ncbi:MAG: hypothetical protein CSA21_05580 [Deltaproteobacteria bacterium]|nr:MAG: hypothetical protein CSA21_05580 [Deltaproteobacteria bacterium]
MSDSDKYTRNLVVKPKRKPVQVDPKTEEDFEESKELVKESVRQAVRTNGAFVTWLGIFSWRLIKHGILSLGMALSSKKDREQTTGHQETSPLSNQNQRAASREARRPRP